MNKEKFFLNIPVNFKPGIFIYPPTVKDVVADNNYGIYVKMLTYSQEEIEDLFVEENSDVTDFPSPFEFLLNNCYHSKEYREVCKKAFEFFLHTPVEFLCEQKVILIGELTSLIQQIESLDELLLITEEEFFSFQNLIREATAHKKLDPPNLNEHPKVKAMKAKARYRDRVKAKQQAKNGSTLFTTLASFCCMGLGLSPLNIGEMSYVAFEAILAQYQAKEKYEIDIDSLLAGADSKKIHPKYWIRNLEED